MNSYQKLKLEVAKLKKEVLDLENAIADGNVSTLQTVKCLVNSRRSIDKVMWVGNAEPNKEGKYNGFIPMNQ